MRRLRKNCFGVAGFFEEIPVLIIVLIGLFLFLASFAHSYGSYVAAQKNIKIHDMANDFSENLRMWGGLLDEFEDSEGVFSYSKMSDPNFENSLTAEFNESMLEFDYRVVIHDVSSYPNKVNAEAGTQEFPDERMEIITINTPAVVVVSSNERHAVLLLITIWGWR
jgi:hypothetical protein